MDDILVWYARTALEPEVRQAADLALSLVTRWRTQRKKTPEEAQLELFDKLEEG